MIAHATDPSVRHADWSRPGTPDALHRFVTRALGFEMPREPLIAGHDGPFAYLEHAFFEDRLPRDCVVWANRGGGKTQLGAIATLLDLMFKPGIQVRILGGSLDQSSKMFAYLKDLLLREDVRSETDPRIMSRSITLANGSRVEVLAQSETSVRGQRVHRLRCDEVELFDPDIWRAAQLVTRSGSCGTVDVRASIEALSTMHRPFGLMHGLVNDDRPTPARRVFRWNVIDVLRRCEPERVCGTCELWNDCRGVAKRANGFIEIDDAIQQMMRVDERTWRAEMLCLVPILTGAVYPEFSEAAHVREFDVRRTGDAHPAGAWVGGIDFGFTAPTVLLWAFATNPKDKAGGMLYVVDEMVESGKLTTRLIERANASRWPRPQMVGADPAGAQTHEQTGESVIATWVRHQWPMKWRKSTIDTGIAMVRRRLRGADGGTRLVIHPRCGNLIKSLATYEYRDGWEVEDTKPKKGDATHACDALRYLILNLESPSSVTVRPYF